MTMCNIPNAYKKTKESRVNASFPRGYPSTTRPSRSNTHSSGDRHQFVHELKLDVRDLGKHSSIQFSSKKVIKKLFILADIIPRAQECRRPRWRNANDSSLESNVLSGRAKGVGTCTVGQSPIRKAPQSKHQCDKIVRGLAQRSEGMYILSSLLAIVPQLRRE